MEKIERSPIGPAGRLLLVLVAAIGALCVIPGTAITARSGGSDGDSRPGSVWVVNRDRGELAVFDAQSGSVLATIPVGAGAHDICISDHAGKAYIAAESINAVTIVDTKTLATTAITVSPLPHHVEPSADGRSIYVSLASHTTTLGAPQLAIIDTADNSVAYVTTSSNPAARAHGPSPSHDGKTIYIAHDTGDEVTGIDAATGQIGFSVKPILRAEEPVATRTGDLLWVSSRGDGTVKRIDLETHTVTGSVPLGVQPESLMLTPSERTLVASLRGSPATLAFVDTVNLSLRGTVPIAGAGSFGDLGVISQDGRFVYATFDNLAAGTGGVAVVDVTSREVVATWPYPGTGRPHGIWYSKKKLR